MKLGVNGSATNLAPLTKNKLRTMIGRLSITPLREAIRESYPEKLEKQRPSM